jgi:hypothetical protein
MNRYLTSHQSDYTLTTPRILSASHSASQSIKAPGLSQSSPSSISFPLPQLRAIIMVQPPTCSGLRVRTARDAEIVFHAVALGILPMVTRRLDSEERMALCSGCVYVWEERTSNVSDSIDHGIERFTEGRSWGPSR